MNPAGINKAQFLEVLDRPALVSIDLIIINPENKVFVGRRVNEPAKGR
jgi:hypothetical protein